MRCFLLLVYAFFFSSRRRHTRSYGDWSSDVCSSDLYDYLLRGDTRADVRLETGDVVFVPIHLSRVRMTGAVLRPAIYETKAGETLSDMIAAAGGFRPDAALERVKVQRFLPPETRGPQTIALVTIDVPMTNDVAPRFALEDGYGVTVASLPGASGLSRFAMT